MTADSKAREAVHGRIIGSKAQSPDNTHDTQDCKKQILLVVGALRTATVIHAPGEFLTA